jgi:hypothetical protein
MPKVTYRLELHNKGDDDEFIRQLLKFKDRAARNGDRRKECKYLCDLQGLYFGNDNFEETVAVSEQIIQKSTKDKEIHISYDRLTKSLLELKEYSRAAETASNYIQIAQLSTHQRSLFDAQTLFGLVYLRKS